jgi:predicted outer membrane protein
MKPRAKLALPIAATLALMAAGYALLAGAGTDRAADKTADKTATATDHSVHLVATDQPQYQYGTGGAGGGGAAALPPGSTMTASGPFGPPDLDLIVKVRQASLWEMPAGQMAQSQASSERVKQVGATLAADHKVLNEVCEKLAAQFGVTIPDTPNADQQSWLAELRGAYGQQFDQIFADRLRGAHGKVFAAIALVRAGTRNNVIRDFATTANSVVMKHMTLLESTGLVNYAALPTAPPPTSKAAPAAAAAGVAPTSVPLAIPGVLLVAALALIVAAFVKWIGLNKSSSPGR